MKKTRPKIGALGPKPYWLELSIVERARTKQYIKEGLQGYVRADGVKIPGARQIYQGLEATRGYDLRHIERWPASRLSHARARIQAVATLTGRPFQVLSTRTKKQRKAAQNYTGQNLAVQKTFIVHVQNPGITKVHFVDGKITVEQRFKGGTRAIERLYLFRDYNDGEQPVTFREMINITKIMMKDMPQKWGKSNAMYALNTIQYGVIGNIVPHHRVLDLLQQYHAVYDNARSHEGFAEQVNGFYMTGTEQQSLELLKKIDRQRTKRRQMKKLRFQKPMRCPYVDPRTDKRCIKTRGHLGNHKTN